MRSDVDFVLTFEELSGIFDAKNISFDDVPSGGKLQASSADGKGFAVSGGVAKAVTNVIKQMDPDREVKVVSAQGLAECKKMMLMAKAGKYNGYLLEGMACPGGCLGGAGVLSDVKKSGAELEKAMAESGFQLSTETNFGSYLTFITEE